MKDTLWAALFVLRKAIVTEIKKVDRFPFYLSKGIVTLTDVPPS